MQGKIWANLYVKHFQFVDFLFIIRLVSLNEIKAISMLIKMIEMNQIDDQ